MYYVTALYVAGVCNYDFCSQFRIVSARSLMETDYDQIFNDKIDLSYICDAYNAVKAVDPDISFFGNADGSGDQSRHQRQQKAP